MKSRLDALQRQRELLREHAQWLDDEIAAERARGAATISPRVVTTTPPAPNHFPSLAPDGGTISPPEPDIKGLHNDVRSGCMFYFLIAAAVLGGVIAFIYWKYGQTPEPALEPTAPPALSPALPPAGGAGLH